MKPTFQEGTGHQLGVMFSSQTYSNQQNLGSLILSLFQTCGLCFLHHSINPHLPKNHPYISWSRSKVAGSGPLALDPTVMDDSGPNLQPDSQSFEASRWSSVSLLVMPCHIRSGRPVTLCFFSSKDFYFLTFHTTIFVFIIIILYFQPFKYFFYR